ncbi:FbpB family small basic protein [Bacillus solitudinis]|nr:FbpB family small basic protein [Bacillus solitudinis]
MRRVRKLTFQELVQENKEKLLKDQKALERIEEQWERRHTKAD